MPGPTGPVPAGSNWTRSPWDSHGPASPARPLGRGCSSGCSAGNRSGWECAFKQGHPDTGRASRAGRPRHFPPSSLLVHLGGAGPSARPRMELQAPGCSPAPPQPSEPLGSGPAAPPSFFQIHKSFFFSGTELGAGAGAIRLSRACDSCSAWDPAAAQAPGRPRRWPRCRRSARTRGRPGWSSAHPGCCGFRDEQQTKLAHDGTAPALLHGFILWTVTVGRCS